MIFRQTRLLVADNTGAKVAMCIGMTSRPADHATIGRVIKVTIKEIRSGIQPKVRPGEVHNALVVRCRQNLSRDDGRVLRFDENAVVLLGQDFKPMGTKVNGPVPMELKKGNWLKVLSLSSRVV
ncbi:50S ribosomal protein L14 [Paramicrosporidium saccamoebae]|uniref:50S ribosomal protein L14 n=1 Tax=Paramicrosporidium saccamoebae TaxID=1246581 RepID=A0A2H9TKL8_9FUNG|nr:50S ribosomal protein L14 [Paramicrosporidium saccamoebae]